MSRQSHKNVASYLANVIEQILSHPGQRPATEALLRSVEAIYDEKLAYGEAIAKLGELSGRFRDLERDIELCAPKRSRHYLSHVVPLKHALCNIWPERTAADYAAGFSRHSVDVLWACSTELVEQAEIPLETIFELKAAIQELMRQIQDSVKDLELRRWLMAHCVEMEKSLNDYFVHGSESLVNAYAKVVGETAVRGERYREELQKAPDDVKKGLAAVWTRFESVVKAVDTSIKAVLIAMQIEGFLTDQTTLKGLPAPVDAVPIPSPTTSEDGLGPRLAALDR